MDTLLSALSPSGTNKSNSPLPKTFSSSTGSSQSSLDNPVAVSFALLAVFIAAFYAFFKPRFYSGIPTDKSRAWVLLGHLPSILGRMASAYRANDRTRKGRKLTLPLGFPSCSATNELMSYYHELLDQHGPVVQSESVRLPSLQIQSSFVWSVAIGMADHLSSRIFASSILLSSHELPQTYDPRVGNWAVSTSAWFRQSFSETAEADFALFSSFLLAGHVW
jgi:hypothetical protein